jgi:predicted nucleotidyltransferase
MKTARRAIVFGSVARGETDAGSDLDFMAGRIAEFFRR